MRAITSLAPSPTSTSHGHAVQQESTLGRSATWLLTPPPQYRTYVRIIPHKHERCRRTCGEYAYSDRRVRTHSRQNDAEGPRVEQFGLTANNVTYGVTGDTLGCWRFLPATERWGRIPAWGR
jgi:hypothetical protein